MSGIAAEELYEYNAQVKGTVEYGASLQAVLAGEAPPPEGLRVDVVFEGPITGRLNGNVAGMDYINLRADGRVDLDIQGTITTDDGEKIALVASCVAIPSRRIEGVLAAGEHEAHDRERKLLVGGPRCRSGVSARLTSARAKSPSRATCPSRHASSPVAMGKPAATAPRCASMRSRRAGALAMT